jgi:2-amino-4-hydroxy-6-hydroxymethyldihydropteridine diphosphokinase
MILVAIGANLPSSEGRSALATCQAAVDAFAALPGLRVSAVSRWFATAPVPASDQPDYINGVARLEGEAEPAMLLSWLQAIEARAGRVRGAPNAARTLDLDIIAMGRLVRDAPDPVLPHPRAHERAFVLVPLLDVAPDWVHPRLSVAARALLAALPPQGVRPCVFPCPSVSNPFTRHG